MILINSQVEIEHMRVAGKMAASLLDYLETIVKPGISTKEINDEAERWTQEHGAISAPLNYAPKNNPPFPGSICTSVNEVICHGIPGNYLLKEGDIINLDVTPITNGFHGDTSRTFIVGEGTKLRKKLVRITKECLDRGIAQVKPGNTLGDIGHAIQIHAEKNGFSIVREFVGHGLGRHFHGPPAVYHFGEPGVGIVLKENMIFTIEPMLNVGLPNVLLLKDKWTAVTKDGSDSAQFEHTILVTKDGVEILTKI